MSLARLEVYAISGALVAGVFVLWKAGKIAADVASGAADVAKGVVSGDNALTKNATDASGTPVTAYQGVPVVGTLGAATNAASGGYLATFGSWLGLSLYDWTHPEDTTTSKPASKVVGGIDFGYVSGSGWDDVAAKVGS